MRCKGPRTVVSLLSQPGLQGACSASHGSPRLSVERDRRRPGPRALFVPAGGSSDTDSETERLLRPEVTARPGRVVGRPSAPTQSQVRGAKGASGADGAMQTPSLKPREPRWTAGLPVPPSAGCHHPVDRTGADRPGRLKKGE